MVPWARCSLLTSSVVQAGNLPALSAALAGIRFKIDAVLFASEYDEVGRTFFTPLSDRGFAALTVQMCRLSEKEVAALEITLLTGAR